MKIKNIKLNKKLVIDFFKNNFNLIILFVLIIVGLFFAFYNFPHRYAFHDDTLRDIAVAISGSSQIQFPLIGGFASTGPFTFGPWTYYQLILISLLIPSYYAPFIYLGIIYTISIVILYMLGKEIADYRFGLILATLGTFSPTLIQGTTHLTTSNILTVFVLTATYLFVKIIKNKNISYWWGFFYGIIMGIAMNMNFQAINLLILALLMLVVKFRKIQYFIAFSAGVVLVFIPLLLFDLNNHWNTVREFLYYLQYGKDAVYVPNRWLFYVRDFWPGLWGDLIGIPNVLAFVIMISTAVVLAYQAYRRKLSLLIFLLALAFFIEFVQMRYFWGERYFGYFSFLRPFIFIFTGYVLYFIYKEVKYGKFVFLILIVLIIFLSLPKSIQKLNVDPMNVNTRSQTEALLKKHPNENFTLYICRESYKSNTADIPKSILFYLDKDNKISEKGTPIIIDSWRCVEEGISTANHPLNQEMNSTNSAYMKIPNSNILVMPNVSIEELTQAGWDSETMRKIHDNTVRWWFDDKP
jgi:hypothetical protein